MSKIQFNELNKTSLEVLDNKATSEVVGGFFDVQTNFAQIFDNDTLLNLQSGGGFFSGGNGATNAITSTNTVIQTNI